MARLAVEKQHRGGAGDRSRAPRIGSRGYPPRIDEEDVLGRREVVEATQALKRAESQVAQGLVAMKAAQAAEAAHARAEAAVASARANAALATANVSSTAWKLTKTKIVSPIDGVVLSRSVEPGQTVAATFQTPVLFKLATDLTALELAVQIGIRLAVGARGIEVLTHFLIEAAVLSLFGGALGIALGRGGSFLGTCAFNLPFAFSPFVIAVAFGFFATVGIVFGFLLARRAARLKPTEALRHE